MNRIRSCEPYRIAFELAASGLALGTVRGTVLRANPAFCEMLGYGSEAELIGTSYRDLTHPADSEELTVLLDQLLSGIRHGFQTEVRCLRRDGSMVWTLTSVALIRDTHERPWYFAAQLQDLTTVREEQELGQTAAVIENHHQIAHAIDSEVLQDLRCAQDALEAHDVAAAREAVDAALAEADRLVGHLLTDHKTVGAQIGRAHV